MQMVITDSNFKLGAVECSSLQVFTTTAANNSIKLSNSSFMGNIYYYYLALLDFHCFPNHTIAELSGVTGNGFTVVYEYNVLNTPYPQDCGMFIENSNLVELVLLSPDIARNGTASQIRFHNVTITSRNGIGAILMNWDVTFVNCTHIISMVIHKQECSVW